MSGEKERGRGDEKIPSCTMFVDKEGQWFHHGAPIIHRELIALFYKCLSVDEEGRYLITLKSQVCRLDVEDTPFVIRRTDLVPGSSPGDKDRFVLHLIDNSEEDLDPQTLSIGPGHVLYCLIREGRFRARFLRQSYYQLTQYIEQDQETKKHFLLLNGEKYFMD
ncbi:MAG: DUF1285 domain-containing protein [Deltaproteobacteria bacterium]|nr:DUF1285 domain-containing protein [Deltaproteobacteria bacterium]